MFGHDQFIRIWTPHIGRGFAEQLVSAYAPLRLLIVLFPFGWGVGFIHALSNGPIHTFSGALNASFPIVLLGIAIVTLVQMHRVGNAIRRAPSNRGFEPATRPSVLTPYRFRSWIVGTRVSPELAAEILSKKDDQSPSLAPRITHRGPAV